jgi:hypothetical protein
VVGKVDDQLEESAQIEFGMHFNEQGLQHLKVRKECLSSPIIPFQFAGVPNSSACAGSGFRREYLVA